MPVLPERPVLQPLQLLEQQLGLPRTRHWQVYLPMLVGGFIAMLLGLPYIVSLRGSDVPFYSKRFLFLDLLDDDLLRLLVRRTS